MDPDVQPDDATRRSGATAAWSAGLLLGVGLGGFVDGIVLHQILQWHHLLSAEGGHPTGTVSGLEANTLADGLFHAFAWACVVAGLALLWRASVDDALPSGRELVGWTLVGWGAFNVVEGLVDHHLLGLHHVREGTTHTLAYDLGFLGVSAVILLAGGTLVRRAERSRPKRAELTARTRSPGSSPRDASPGR